MDTRTTATAMLMALSPLVWGCDDTSTSPTMAEPDTGAEMSEDTRQSNVDTTPTVDTRVPATDPEALFSTLDIVWEPCPLEEGETDTDADCSTTAMPMFWEAHDGSTLDVRAKRLRPEGDVTAQLWLVHGGPGASGVIGFPPLMASIQSLFPGLEVYTLDHRGTGYSGFLECPEQQASDSPQGAAISSDELEDCIAAMRQQWGDGLETFGSTSSAIDLAAYMSASRRPDTPVYLWGGSYGAYLALRFLRLFPALSDGVILEGIVKPDTTFIDHDHTADTAGRALLAACAQDETCASRFDDHPEAVMREALERHREGLCEAIDIAPEAFQLLLVYMMYSFTTSSAVPALIHRYHRCAPEDGAALGFLWNTLFGDQGQWVADATDRSYSLLLQIHVINSEMWAHPNHRLAEVRPRLESFWEACLFCRRNIETYVNTYDIWPRYDDAPYDNSYAESSVPMLMMHGRLDPTASATEAEEVGAWFNGPHQTFIMFPQAAHNITSGTPYRPLTPACGVTLWLDFMTDPTGDLDNRCVEQVYPLNFEGSTTLAQALLGTDSYFDLAGAQGKGNPTQAQVMVDALKEIRQRIQRDRWALYARQP
ncbi:MAG: alpha/beta fold hydrolase [Myxococcota bacterium]